jgi:hypothetical protein
MGSTTIFRLLNPMLSKVPFSVAVCVIGSLISKYWSVPSMLEVMLSLKIALEAGATSGRKIRGQATQAIYEITVLEEYAKLNALTGTITVALGISAKVGDLSLADPVIGTYVWTHQEEECLRTLVQLYRGPFKILSNCSNTLEGA